MTVRNTLLTSVAVLGVLLGALPRVDAAMWRALEAELDPHGTLAPDSLALGRVLP